MVIERFAFTDRAIQIFAEDKFQTAIHEGLFDNLPGLGQAFAWCDEPYDPNWWIRQTTPGRGPAIFRRPTIVAISLVGG